MRRQLEIVWILIVVLTALLVGLIAVMARPSAGDPARVAEQLDIKDKPAPEELIEAAQTEAEEPYGEESEEYAAYDYQPAYSQSYWYESDDADAEAEAKEWIAWRESGGDYGARNGQYVGRYQLNEMYLDGDYSEENQEKAAEAYIADRYGSWQAAQDHWEAYGWY